MDIHFSPSNELTFSSVKEDTLRLRKILKDEKNQSICLDLNKVSHCDSAGLALLIEAKRLCSQYKKNLRIQGAAASIYALAEFCGVEWILG